MVKILIVEDNAVNLKLTTLLVQRAGHSILQALDAESGLVLARSELPDLVLMDIQLPGMDGFQAIAEMRADPITTHIPVIALTALAMSRDADKARAARCDAYITKPLRYQELCDAINWLIPRSEDEGVFMPNPPEQTNPNQADDLTDTVVRSDEAPTDSRPTLAQSGGSNSGAKRILVAEDNPTNQKLLVWQLTLLGYESEVVDNGVLALARWEDGDFHLVITDLHMPEMNGYDLAAAIRASEPEGSRVPILAMTASGMEGDADNSRLKSMNGYLMRPLHLAKLRAALSKWLP